MEIMGGGRGGERGEQVESPYLVDFQNAIQYRIKSTIALTALVSSTTSWNELHSQRIFNFTLLSQPIQKILRSALQEHPPEMLDLHDSVFSNILKMKMDHEAF